MEMTKILFARILIKLEIAIEVENKKLWKKYVDSGNIPLIGLSTCYVPVKYKNKEVELHFFDININFKSEKIVVSILNMSSLDHEDNNLLKNISSFNNSNDVIKHVTNIALPILKENVKNAIKLYNSLK